MSGKNSKRPTDKGGGPERKRQKVTRTPKYSVERNADDSLRDSVEGIATFKLLEEVKSPSNRVVKTTTPCSSINHIPSVMMTAPLYSGADICAMVIDLNNAVRQAAVSITDASFELPREENGRRGNNEARQFIKSKMINCIYTAQGTDFGEGLQKGLLQRGLEGVMVVACSEMLATWSTDKVESEILGNLYKSNIQQKAKKVLSGYWQAMAKKAAKLSVHAIVEKALLHCLEQVVNQILHISGRWNFDRDSPIQEGIWDVCQAATRLDKVLSEDPTDDVWEVFYALPDSKIDIDTTKPSIIDGEMSVSQGLVICPTDLGLRRANFTNASSDIPSSSVNSGWKIIIKAKALLEENRMG